MVNMMKIIYILILLLANMTIKAEDIPGIKSVNVKKDTKEGLLFFLHEEDCSDCNLNSILSFSSMLNTNDNFDIYIVIKLKNANDIIEYQELFHPYKVFADTSANTFKYYAIIYNFQTHKIQSYLDYKFVRHNTLSEKEIRNELIKNSIKQINFIQSDSTNRILSIGNLQKIDDENVLLFDDITGKTFQLKENKREVTFLYKLPLKIGRAFEKAKENKIWDLIESATKNHLFTTQSMFYTDVDWTYYLVELCTGFNKISDNDILMINSQVVVRLNRNSLVYQILDLNFNRYKIDKIIKSSLTDDFYIIATWKSLYNENIKDKKYDYSIYKDSVLSLFKYNINKQEVNKIVDNLHFLNKKELNNIYLDATDYFSAIKEKDSVLISYSYATDETLEISNNKINIINVETFKQFKQNCKFFIDDAHIYGVNLQDNNFTIYKSFQNSKIQEFTFKLNIENIDSYEIMDFTNHILTIVVKNKDAKISLFNIYI